MALDPFAWQQMLGRPRRRNLAQAYLLQMLLGNAWGNPFSMPGPFPFQRREPENAMLEPIGAYQQQPPQVVRPPVRYEQFVAF